MQKWMKSWVEQNLKSPAFQPDSGVKWNARKQVLEFKKLWEDFQNASSVKEKAQLLAQVLALFVSLLEGRSIATEHIHDLVEVRPFAYVVGRHFAESIEKLKGETPGGPLSSAAVITFLSNQDGEISGPILLATLEYLVLPGLDVRGLLDAGVLGTLVAIFHGFVDARPSAGTAEGQENVSEDADGRQHVVQAQIEHIMNSLSAYKGAAKSLCQDDSLKTLFQLVGIDVGKGSSEDEKKHPVLGSIERKKQRHKASKILLTVLDCDTGAVAGYIREHKLVDDLLKVVYQFDVDTGDSHHTLMVVSLIIECLKLSSKPDAGDVDLSEDFKARRGYFWMCQLALKLTFAPEAQMLSPNSMDMSPPRPSLGFQIAEPPEPPASSAEQKEIDFQAQSDNACPKSPRKNSPPASDSSAEPLARTGCLPSWPVSQPQVINPLAAPLKPPPGSPQRALGVLPPSSSKGTSIERMGSLSLWSSKPGAGEKKALPEDTKKPEPSQKVAPALVKLLDLLVAMAQVGMPRPVSPRAEEIGAQILRSASRRSPDLASLGAGQGGVAWRIRDVDAVQVLQDIFLQTKQVPVQLMVLDRIQSLYAGHPENFEVIQDLRTLPSFIRGMTSYPPQLQEKILRLLEYTVIVVSVVPEQELLALCGELERPVAPAMAQTALAFFAKLLSFENQLKDVLRMVGFLDILIADLKNCQPIEARLEGSSKYPGRAYGSSSDMSLGSEGHSSARNPSTWRNPDGPNLRRTSISVSDGFFTGAATQDMLSSQQSQGSEGFPTQLSSARNPSTWRNPDGPNLRRNSISSSDGLFTGAAAQDMLSSQQSQGSEGFPTHSSARNPSTWRNPDGPNLRRTSISVSDGFFTGAATQDMLSSQQSQGSEGFPTQLSSARNPSTWRNPDGPNLRRNSISSSDGLFTGAAAQDMLSSQQSQGSEGFPTHSSARNPSTWRNPDGPNLRRTSISVSDGFFTGAGSSVSYLFGEEESRKLAYECLLGLLQRNSDNQQLFRQKRGVQALWPLLACNCHRAGALQLLSCLICEDVDQQSSEELSGLVQAVKKGLVGGPGLAPGQGPRMWRLLSAARTEILWTIWRTMGTNPAAQETFLKVEGFSLPLPLLQSLRGTEPSPMEGKGGMLKKAPMSLGDSRSGLSRTFSVAVEKDPESRGNGAAAVEGDIQSRSAEWEKGSQGILPLGGLEEPQQRAGGASSVGEPEDNVSLSSVLAEVAGKGPRSASSMGAADGVGEGEFPKLKKPAARPGTASSGGFGLDSQLPAKMDVLDALFNALTLAVKSRPMARLALRENLRPEVGKKLLPATGLLGSAYDEQLADLLLDLATETIRKKDKSARRQISRGKEAEAEGPSEFDWRKVDPAAYISSIAAGHLEGKAGGEMQRVYNAGAVQALLECLPHLSHTVQLRVLVTVDLLARMGPPNQEALCGAGCVGIVLEFLKPQLATLTAPVTTIGLHIIEQLGRFRLSGGELRSLASYLRQPKDSPSSQIAERFLRMLERMAWSGGGWLQSMAFSPFLYLSLTGCGYAYAQASLGERMWPPVGGFTFACSLQFHGLRGSSEPFPGGPVGTHRRAPSGGAPVSSCFSLFSVSPTQEGATPLTEASIDAKGVLTLSTGLHTKLTFSDVQLEEGVWYHITLTFSKPSALAGLFSSSVASLYIDGSLRQSGKLGYTTSAVGQELQVVLGTAKHSAVVAPITWMLGPMYLFEEVLPFPAVLLMYLLGRNYPGTFQDDNMEIWVPLEACTGPNLVQVEIAEKEAAASGIGGLWSKAEEPGADKADGSKVTWEDRPPPAVVAMLQSKKLIFKFDGSTVEVCPTALAQSMVNLVDQGSSAASTITGVPQIAGLFGDVQICAPSGVPDGLRKIGGVAVVLAIVEMADSQAKLHLAISLLAGTLRHNPRNVLDMKRLRGYHLLALFLHQRMPLLGMKGLDLLLQIAATDSHSDTHDGTQLAKGSEPGPGPFAGEAGEGSSEVWHTMVLSNVAMVKDILLDWTLWVRAPVTLQLALLAFLESTVLRNRYQRHNITVLRRLNIVDRLLVTLQRGDMEGVVMERGARLLGVVLADGLLETELTRVGDFLVMTFRPSLDGSLPPPRGQGGDGAAGWEYSGRAVSASGHPFAGWSSTPGTSGPLRVSGGLGGHREALGMHVVIRNILLEMLVKLQMNLKADESVELWHRLVSIKVLTFLLDEDVHPTTMCWLLVLLGGALSHSQFAARFKANGGYPTLHQVLPHFYDEPEVYYLLAAIMFGQRLYPRLAHVRLTDFYALLASKAAQEELRCLELMECFTTMLKEAFQRQPSASQGSRALRAQQMTAASDAFRVPAEASFGNVEMIEGGRTSLYSPSPNSLPLMGGPAAACTLATSLLRMLADGVTISQGLASACRRQEFLETGVEIYLAGVRAAHIGLLKRKLQKDKERERERRKEEREKEKERELAKECLQVAKVESSSDVEVHSQDKPMTCEESSEGQGTGSQSPDPSEVVDLTLGLNLRPINTSPSPSAQTSPRRSQSTPEVDKPPPAPLPSLPPLSPLAALGSMFSVNEVATWSVHETPVDSSSLGMSSGYGVGMSEEVLEMEFEAVTVQTLLRVEAARAEAGPAVVGAKAVLDLLAEVLAVALLEEAKGMGAVDVALEGMPLEVPTEAALVYSGLCLGRLMRVLERRLVLEPAQAKLLNPFVWGPNLDSLSTLVVDRVYMGAFGQPGGCKGVLHFLVALLHMANVDRKVEKALPPGRAARSRDRFRNLEPYVQAILKNINRLVMYSFLPPLLTGLSQEHARLDPMGSEVTDLGSMENVPIDCSLASADALQLLVENCKVMLCPSNVDPEFMCCLCHNLTHMLWDKDAKTRRLAVQAWKVLLEKQWDELSNFLTFSTARGEIVDVLNGGFEIMAVEGEAKFFEWLRQEEDMVYEVLDNRASPTWMEFIASSTRLPGARIKAVESRRKKEMGRRATVLSRASSKHEEQRSQRGRTLEQVRHTIAVDLRALRQDKYGWVVHAEREWQGHVRDLIHERGIWPIWGGPMAVVQVRWQLCPTEGPYRMRQRLERVKVGVRLSAPYPLAYPGDQLQEEDLPGAQLSLNPDLAEALVAFAPAAAADNPLADPEAKKEESAPAGMWPAGDAYLDQFSREAIASQPLRGFLSTKFLDSIENELATVGEGEEDRETTEEDSETAQTLSTLGSTEGEGGNLELDREKPRQKPLRLGSIGSYSELISLEEEDFLGSPDAESVRGEDKEESLDLTTEGIKVVEDSGEHLIRPYLEPGERLRHKYNCERIVGLDKRDGVFLIGELCLYVMENFYLDKEGRICGKEGDEEASVLDQALGVDKNPFAQPKKEGAKPQGLVGGWGDTAAAWRDAGTMGEGWRSVQGYQGGAPLVHNWRTWKLDDVHEMLKRRYQLRPVALELFSMNGNNDLLVFHISERDAVFKNLLALNLPRNSMLDATISGSGSGGEPGQLFRRMANTFGTRWQNGEISNFQYLMHLNTLAGRGYNDLTQYPVFPWVLADYHSAELDLSNPESFRRLDKPMGCLTAEREEEFKRRYDTWDDPEIPKFHYGSHYSSAGIVLYYLIRLPPFSRENIQLQGGHFDHADRLFTSIGETWRSASTGHTADVKELTPEFFYMSMVLENRFDLDLGTKQSGEKVGDVLLPPWAHGSAREFVRKHREALESEYVSAHLHEWINLIFGYKQQGKAAREATNVFFYLTYEGAVDIDSIKDPSTKASILAQINHFGQTPRQLFMKPHPRRRSRQKPPRLSVLRQHHLLQPREIRTMPTRVTQILMIRDKLGVLVGDSLMKPPAYDKAFLWGFPDGSCRIRATDQDRLLYTGEGLHECGPIQCAAVSRDGNLLATGGADEVVAVWRLQADGSRGYRLKLQRTLCAHTQAVTALAMCQPWSILVSGSDDRSVILWDLNTLEFIHQLPELPAAVTAVHVNEMTGDIITAAGTMLGVWSIHGDCLAAVNTSNLMAESITSLATPSFSDWMETDWYITGHRHGNIKIWALERGDQATQLWQNHSRRNVTAGALARGAMANPMGRTAAAAGTAESASGPEGPAPPTGEEVLPEAPHPEQGQGGNETFLPRRTPSFRLALRKELEWHEEPVSALFLKPDLRQLFSGDLGGHVAEWALPEGAEGGDFEKIKQLEAPGACRVCKKVLKAWDRRHVCCNCGQTACSECSGNRAPLEELGHLTAVRVCDDCFDSRQATGLPHARGLLRGSSLSHAFSLTSSTALPPSSASQHHHQRPSVGPNRKPRTSMSMSRTSSLGLPSF